MAISFAKLFQPGFLPSSEGSLYTIPATPTTNLLSNGRVRLTNITASAVAVTLYAVPASGAAAGNNTFLPGVSIGPKDYIDVDVPQLGPGDSIHGVADTASAINIQAMDGFLQS